MIQIIIEKAISPTTGSLAERVLLCSAEGSEQEILPERAVVMIDGWSRYVHAWARERYHNHRAPKQFLWRDLTTGQQTQLDHVDE